MLCQVLVWLILSFSGYLFNVCLFPLEGKLLEAEFMPALLTAVLPAPSTVPGTQYSLSEHLLSE